MTEHHSFRAYWLYAMGLHETIIYRRIILATNMNEHDADYLKKCLWVLKKHKVSIK